MKNFKKKLFYMAYMGVEQSDTENLEELLKGKQQATENIEGDLKAYFQKKAEKEPNRPIIGFDSENRIVYVSQRAKQELGSKVARMIIDKTPQELVGGFLKQEHVDEFRELVKLSHLAKEYNFIHFKLARYDVKVDIKRNKQGKYLCGIGDIRKEEMSLADRLAAIIHLPPKPKAGIGKDFPDIENTQYRIIKLETLHGLRSINLETIAERVNYRLAIDSMKNLFLTLQEENEKTTDVIIDLADSPYIQKKALYKIAEFAYYLEICFPEKAKIKIRADKETRQRYEEYLEDVGHEIKINKMTKTAVPWKEELDEFKIRHIHDALMAGVKRIEMLPEKTSEKELRQAVIREYRNAFKRMLIASGLYNGRRNLKYMKDVTGNRAFALAEKEKSDSFIKRMYLTMGTEKMLKGEKEKPEIKEHRHDKIYLFMKIVRRFRTERWTKKIKYERIKELYKPEFEKYIKEVYPKPESPPQLKGEMPKPKKAKEEPKPLL